MKKFSFAIVCILIFIFFSCSIPGALDIPENIDYIKSLAGDPKDSGSWGTIIDSIPYNIGNTFWINPQTNTTDPQTTRTISWQSTLDTGEVIIGETHYQAVTVQDGSQFFHRVDLTGLAAGKTYSYIVGTEGAYSPVYSFTTGSSGDNFSILHITDPQIGTGTLKGDSQVWRFLIEAAVKKFPDAAFIVNTGDIVNNAAETAIPYYFDYAQKVLANYAFVYSMGNNDNVDWYNKYFTVPQNNYDAGDDTKSALYSFDYGNVHFINIDSYTDLKDLQIDWLRNDLKNTDKVWKVAMMHEGCYGNKNDITSLLDTYNVDLVLAGHEHFYMRSRPMDMAGYYKLNGTVWTIPNVAGTKYNNLPSPKPAYYVINKQPKLPMFTEINFSGTTLTLSAYTFDMMTGVIASFDTYQVSKN
ncbi:MAG: metallophosphoesterase family protein [Treponema sp.]|nr:metallophosphoesterase family protein [Treponema sp.]